MKLNLSSSSSSVSSFPASLHTTHTAVWGRTGWIKTKQVGITFKQIHTCLISYVSIFRRETVAYLLFIYLLTVNTSLQFIKTNHTVLYTPVNTHSNTLPHDAGLLHTSRPSELLHVLAKVTLSTLSTEARLALSASRPPAPRSRRAAIGCQLNS